MCQMAVEIEVSWPKLFSPEKPHWLCFLIFAERRPTERGHQPLASGARVHYVVGNSKFYDVLLPTEEIYASLFASVELSDISIERIRKRTSKKELFEFVVHAKKT